MSTVPVYVLGVGMTPFGRHPALSVKQLTRWAVDDALADAGLTAQAIQAAFFANATQGHMEGQHMIRGEIALRSMGIGGIPVVNVENACASGSTALQLAVTALKAGDADVALAVGAEKMVSANRDLMFSAFAAVVVGTAAGLKRHGLDPKRAIRVLAAVVQSGSDRIPDDVHRHCTALAARRAYDAAGIGPGEVNVAEVHDATAMGEIIQVENLGFCAYGEGGELAERGDTRIGGRIPVNPSGGLESKGHPVGATGLGQIHELVTQLRGEAGSRQVASARIAIAENGGGLQGIEEAVACITILRRDGS